MKLQRSTGILLVVAIALATTVAILETQTGTSSDNSETLYNFTEADISSLVIEKEDETLAFSKIENTWEMSEPEKAPADPSSIAFLLNIITTEAIKETIKTTKSDLDIYGLDEPFATITLRVDEESHRLSIGDEDFSGTSLYVMTADDSLDSKSLNIHLISNGLENGIERPINDWIATNENNQDQTVESSDKDTQTPQN